MSLVSVSALEVSFVGRPSDDVLLTIDELVNVIKCDSDCLNYVMVALNKQFSSLIISGFWSDEESMVEHYSTPTFSALLDCLSNNCKSICFRSFFAREELSI
ncbi:hypothetical protein ACNE9Y_29915 [Pseudomonas sp. NY11226]|uniref:hypothetical protein n=1 Tax=unclassified Pseudomonas TaxID=196821 RepID=UPI0031F6A9EF